MSFSAEPFSECTIVFNGDTTFEFRCDSCGGGHKKTFHEDSTLFELQEAYYEHLEHSHELTLRADGNGESMTTIELCLMEFVVNKNGGDLATQAIRTIRIDDGNAHLIEINGQLISIRIPNHK